MERKDFFILHQPSFPVFKLREARIVKGFLYRQVKHAPAELEIELKPEIVLKKFPSRTIRDSETEVFTIHEKTFRENYWFRLSLDEIEFSHFEQF